MERRKRRRPLSQMSNREVKDMLAQRSLMLSWVAYLDDEDEKLQVKYIKDALKGIEMIDAEIEKREMQVSCH